MTLLEDHEGKASTMRVMSFMALFAAIIFGWIDVVNQATAPYVTFAFLLAAFCPKAFQAFVEKHTGVIPKKEKKDAVSS